MEAQDVPIFNGVSDRVSVQLLLKNIISRDVRGLLAINLLIRCVLFENRRPSESKELRLGKKLFDSAMVFPELRAMALIENEHDAFVAQWCEALFVVLLVCAIQCQTQLLNRCNDNFVCDVVGEQPADKGFGVGVLFDAAFLEAVELFTGLPVEVFSVHHEQALLNVGVILQERRGFERRQRLAAPGCVPDVTVSAVLLDAIDNRLNRVDLIRAHHKQLLLARDQHHVTADHLPKSTFRQKFRGKLIEVRDLPIVFTGVLVKRQKPLISVETKVAAVIVCKVPGIATVADNK